MCGQRCRNFCSKWRLWIRPVIFVIYGAIILVCLPYYIWQVTKEGNFKYKSIAKITGGVFVFLAIPITLWEIIQHLINYTKPKLQKHIIRILWMVPVYALNAWLVLAFPEQGLYLDTARECYEAYVIYNFMIFLLNFLDDVMDLDAIMETKPQMNHIFPLCCLKPWPMGREFIHRCKHGILQYTVFHLITTFIAFVCGLANVYGEGDFSPKKAFVYLFVINNLSQFVAMYCLVLFYKAMRRELDPMSPLAKFLCIKAVVFFSFFQGVGIMFLVKFGNFEVIKELDEDEKQKLSNAFQNYLICVEMFIAAVVHHFAFSYKPYVDPEYENGNCCHAFLLMWDISDVRSDLREHVHVVREGVKRRLTTRGWRGGAGGVGGGLVGERGDERTRLIPPLSQSTSAVIPGSGLHRYMSTSDSEHDIQIEHEEVSDYEVGVVET
ncbi:transmembrane protein 184C isoform X2 [Oratosquilla oratoria]